MSVRAVALVSVCLTAFALPAQAHVCMDAPASRVGPGCSLASPQKVGPCGVAGRSQYVTTFRPGETIEVQIRETIDHPSHYRIAFNPDGDSFEDPTSKDDKSGGHPYVLLDGIEDTASAQQTVQVTLPNVACTRCTLQLIQVMYDKGNNGFGGNDGAGPAADNDDLYYACADLVLAGEPVAGGDAGAPSDGGTQPTDAGAQPSDAAAPVDASAVGADASAPTPPPSASGGSNSPGTDAGSGQPSSDSGCSLARAGQARSVDLSLLALGLLALVRRRQRNAR